MRSIQLLDTPLQVTSLEEWASRCAEWTREHRTVAVGFANTHLLALSRADRGFREEIASLDYFVPDSAPVYWCVRWRSRRLGRRIYGPDFLRHCLTSGPGDITHYFLGGSDECLRRLKLLACEAGSTCRVVGCHSGFFDPDDSGDDSAAAVEEINRLSPDFIWVGLGAPKQERWIARWKPSIRRGVVLAVGFAFDANAGTKRDAPLWMRRAGLGWLFRLVQEPGRLGPRYLKYNSLFLWYLLVEVLRGSAYRRHV